MNKASDNLPQLTQQELENLDRAVLSEQVCRTLNNSDAVVVEPEALESAHEQAIRTVLQHKGIEQSER